MRIHILLFSHPIHIKHSRNHSVWRLWAQRMDPQPWKLDHGSPTELCASSTKWGPTLKLSNLWMYACCRRNLNISECLNMYGCTIYWKDRSFQFAIAVRDTLIVVMNQYNTVQLDKTTRTIQPG